MGTVPKHSSEFGVTSTTSRVFSTASTSSCVSSTNFNVLPINFNFIMSWQEYVNTQMVGKNLKEAAIGGTEVLLPLGGRARSQGKARQGGRSCHAHQTDSS